MFCDSRLQTTDRQRANGYWKINYVTRTTSSDDRPTTREPIFENKLCSKSDVLRRPTDNARIDIRRYRSFQRLTTDRQRASRYWQNYRVELRCSRPTTRENVNFSTDPPFTWDPTGRVRIDVERNGFHRSNPNRWPDIIGPIHFPAI